MKNYHNNNKSKEKIMRNISLKLQIDQNIHIKEITSLLRMKRRKY